MKNYRGRGQGGGGAISFIKMFFQQSEECKSTNLKMFNQNNVNLKNFPQPWWDIHLKIKT